MLGIGEIADFATTIVNKIFPDKTQTEKDKLALQVQAATQNFQLTQGQIETNKIEAANNNVFVSGWRPFIGWICGFAFLFNYILVPVVFEPLLRIFHQPDISPLQVSEMVPVLVGMLGLGAYRTAERISGVIPKGK